MQFKFSVDLFSQSVSAIYNIELLPAQTSSVMVLAGEASLKVLISPDI